MFLKPKNTVLHKPAMLYRRFTQIETALQGGTVYRAYAPDGTYKAYVFDEVTVEFVAVDFANFPNATIVDLPYAGSVVLEYKDGYFSNSGGSLIEIDKPSEGELATIAGGRIGRYQLNKYYYAGSFDYIVKGSVEGTTTQFLKGNIMPLSSLSITHYNDYINLCPDDLVIIDGRLYSVENCEVTHKHQPKEYNIYYATLNSIL